MENLQIFDTEHPEMQEEVLNVTDSYTVHHELVEMIDDGWDASEALAFLNID